MSDNLLKHLTNQMNQFKEKLDHYNDLPFKTALWGASSEEQFKYDDREKEKLRKIIQVFQEKIDKLNNTVAL